jgi:GNAT superfamily N-acetyltransferase
VERFLARGGPLTDIMGIVLRREVLGFAHLFHSRSSWIGPSIAWAGRDASRVGGLGPMGVDPTLRGQGLGLALLDQAMVHLASLGVDEMVIDWTVLLEFYGKLGFVPRRHYQHGERTP